MITILSIVGTRPEVIKMAPVLLELRRHTGNIRSVLCSTGQHREMLSQAFELFDLEPDYDLRVMQPNQTLSALTAQLFARLAPVIEHEKPDWILAQGDTTTVFVAAMMAYYHRVRFGHVEAGLRTGDPYSPFPEEINRRIADLLADLCFAPTEHSRETLISEGYPAERIIVTGNPIVDALQMIKQQPYDWSVGPLGHIPRDCPLVVVTAHRRESFGRPLEQICLAIRDLALEYGARVQFVFPVHHNPNVREIVFRYLSELQNVHLIEPLDYAAMVHLMASSRLILTDSGGIQEEGPSLGVPVLVMRETTERPEGVWTGMARLIGTNRQRIVEEVKRELSEDSRPISGKHSLYGDGTAAQKIAVALLRYDVMQKHACVRKDAGRNASR